MKRTASLVLSLVLALSLASCAPSEPTPTPPPDPSPVVTPEATPAPVEGSFTLTYYPEGQETTIATAQFLGEGYTIHVPTQDWGSVLDTGDGYEAVTLHSTVNESVCLRVYTLSGLDRLDTVQDFLKDAYPGFALIEDNRGGLGGEHEDGRLLDSRIFLTEEGAYALVLLYPPEAAEGFGMLLSAMADTFTLT